MAATDKGDADLHRGELTRQPFARHLVITFVAAVFKFADEGFFGGGTAQTQRRRAKAAPGSSPRGIRSEPFVHKVLLLTQNVPRGRRASIDNNKLPRPGQSMRHEYRDGHSLQHAAGDTAEHELA